jgi:serine/threonine protein kinase
MFGMLQPETVLAGRYRITDVLAQGDVGVVYRAMDERLVRPVAAKTVGRDDPDLVIRLRREARTLARLSHPNIVSVYDVTEHEGRPYLVSELAAGTPLKDLLGRMSPDRIAAVGEQIARALVAAHAVGVVHRDLRPGNILVDGSTVRLLDFGIAGRMEDTALTMAGGLLDTATYLSPEQLRGEPATPAADLYALGLVLIECCTGRPAFPGTSTETVSARLAGPPDVPDQVPAEWRPMVSALVDPDPERRPTAEAVVSTLQTGDGAETARPAPPPPPPPPPPERSDDADERDTDGATAAMAAATLATSDTDHDQADAGGPTTAPLATSDTDHGDADADARKRTVVLAPAPPPPPFVTNGGGERDAWPSADLAPAPPPDDAGAAGEGDAARPAAALAAAAAPAPIAADDPAEPPTRPSDRADAHADPPSDRATTPAGGHRARPGLVAAAVAAGVALLAVTAVLVLAGDPPSPAAPTANDAGDGSGAPQPSSPSAEESNPTVTAIGPDGQVVTITAGDPLAPAPGAGPGAVAGAPLPNPASPAPPGAPAQPGGASASNPGGAPAANPGAAPPPAGGAPAGAVTPAPPPAASGAVVPPVTVPSVTVPTPTVAPPTVPPPVNPPIDENGRPLPVPVRAQPAKGAVRVLLDVVGQVIGLVTGP